MNATVADDSGDRVGQKRESRSHRSGDGGEQNDGAPDTRAQPPMLRARCQIGHNGLAAAATRARAGAKICAATEYSATARDEETWLRTMRSSWTAIGVAMLVTSTGPASARTTLQAVAGGPRQRPATNAAS